MRKSPTVGGDGSRGAASTARKGSFLPPIRTYAARGGGDEATSIGTPSGATSRRGAQTMDS